MCKHGVPPSCLFSLQLHLAFTFAQAHLCLDVAASLVLPTQGLLLGVELEGFLIALGKDVTDDILKDERFSHLYIHQGCFCLKDECAKMLFFTRDMLKDGCASKAKQFSNKFTKTTTKARYRSHERSESQRGGDETDLGLDTALANNERDALLREQQDVKEATLKIKTNASPPDENCT